MNFLFRRQGVFKSGTMNLFFYFASKSSQTSRNTEGNVPKVLINWLQTCSFYSFPIQILSNNFIVKKWPDCVWGRTVVLWLWAREWLVVPGTGGVRPERGDWREERGERGANLVDNLLSSAVVPPAASDTGRQYFYSRTVRNVERSPSSSSNSKVKTRNLGSFLFKSIFHVHPIVRSSI